MRHEKHHTKLQATTIGKACSLNLSEIRSCWSPSIFSLLKREIWGSIESFIRVTMVFHSSVVDFTLVKQRRMMGDVQHAHVGAANAAERYSQPGTEGPEHHNG